MIEPDAIRQMKAQAQEALDTAQARISFTPGHVIGLCDTALAGMEDKECLDWLDEYAENIAADGCMFPGELDVSTTLRVWIGKMRDRFEQYRNDSHDERCAERFTE